MTRPEAILEARRMLATGEFLRSVVASAPKNIACDTVTLECGHDTWRLCGQPVLECVLCHDCAADWIRAHSEPSEEEKEREQEKQQRQESLDLTTKLLKRVEEGR